MFQSIAGVLFSLSMFLIPPSVYSQESRSVGLLQLTLEGSKTDSWHDFRRHTFMFEGREAWIVEPKVPRSDRAFTWCMMFPDAFTERCAAPAMLERGFYHVFLDVGNSFGSPEAVKTLHRFHQQLRELGLSQKTILIGISRGGFYAHRYATEYPDRVALIYGDAPVLDFKSWPAGFGNGKGSQGDWELCKKLYGLESDDAAKQFQGNPIDTLEVLAKAKIPLVYVVGDKDDVVPYSENTAIVEERYPKLGGTIKVFHKPDIGHHPHGLDNPVPLVEYIETHFDQKL